MYLPTPADEAVIKNILAKGETAVVVEAGDTVEILGVANYPRVCREYYVGRFVVAVFRTPGDLEARLVLAQAKAASSH